MPCPCRTNAKPTYGHCEATLLLRIVRGNYEAVNLDGMILVEVAGMCAVNCHELSNLYFSSTDSAERQSACMKLVSSMFPNPVKFSHV